jgi:exoribonuclease R
MKYEYTYKDICIYLLMSTYNNKYDELVEPMYGVKRDSTSDNILLQSNVIPHAYSVTERIDMTMHKTYSIDPAGCEDADDAFSIY